MPKTFPEEQKMRVRKLSAEGMTNTDIAAKMKEEYPDDWGSEYAHRTVARILKEEVPEYIEQSDKTLDEMTRDERFKLIESKLRSTPRYRMVFKNFSDDDKEVFTDEYLSLVKSTDTLTEAEEQALFACALEYVLAFQALGRKEREEKLRDETLDGMHDEESPKYRRHVDDKYQREYDQHMKLYQKGMDGLKMSRSQRLKEVRSQKQTLVDLAEELSNKSSQSEAAIEIERLSRLKDEELKRLVESGYLYGVFE